MSKELIYDFETLGVSRLHNMTVLDVSLFAFKRDRFLTTDPYTFDEIISEACRVKFSVYDQVKTYKTGREQGAMDFWQSLPKEDVEHTFVKSDNDLTVADGIDKVAQYIESQGSISYWWTRGNAFDPVIMEGQFDKLGLIDKYKELLKYNMVRDTRSYIDGFFGIGIDNGFIPAETDNEIEELNRKFKKHRSTHDIAMDVLRLQSIERIREGL